MSNANSFSSPSVCKVQHKWGIRSKRSNFSSLPNCANGKKFHEEQCDDDRCFLNITRKSSNKRKRKKEKLPIYSWIFLNTNWENCKKVLNTTQGEIWDDFLCATAKTKRVGKLFESSVHRRRRLICYHFIRQINIEKTILISKWKTCSETSMNGAIKWWLWIDGIEEVQRLFVNDVNLCKKFKVKRYEILT